VEKEFDMRRSLFAGIGVAAVLILAACSPDQTRQEPLAPADAGLAKGGGGGGGSKLCAGGAASEISKLQKNLFTDPIELGLIEGDFDAIKGACPIVLADPAELAILTTYLARMIEFSDAPVSTTSNRAEDLVSLLAQVTEYATNDEPPVVRDASIFRNQGGAAVLSSPGVMTNWGPLNFARLEVQNPTNHSGPHLWTLEPRESIDCDNTTSLRATGRCYQIHDYPDETTAYDLPFIVTLCHPSHAFAQSGVPAGIGHQTAATHAFGGKAEVLEETTVGFFCDHTTAAIDGWLGRKAGPLGRAVARAYDYLRPRPLFADDAGESGLGLFTSLFGGILNNVFSDNFDDPTTFNAQRSGPPGPTVTDTPDLGAGNWLFKSQSPGYIRIQNALGDMVPTEGDTGIVVLSQGQGACTSCPLFRLLGTSTTANETIGSYAITWRSLQNKPNVKEAPFVILNAISANGNTHDKSIEIARLSYVTVSSQNKLLFIVRSGINDSTVYEVPGGWVKDVSQKFTVTVNLTTLDPAFSQRISLSVNDVPVAAVQNVQAPRATLLKQIGYVLAGIDAGIIGSDNWVITRLEDIPPP
jgi:hypothetical protein